MGDLNELKNDSVKQGKTISNLTVNLNELKNDTVKQGKTISNQEKDIKKLKTDDIKQGKSIKNLNARVDKLAKKECQIGKKTTKSNSNLRMKENFSRHDIDVQVSKMYFDVTFPKRFSETPDILLSPTELYFEARFAGWHVYANHVSPTGFRLNLQGHKDVNIRYFEIYY